MSVRIVTNYLDNNKLFEIQNLMMSGSIPWYQYPNLIFRHPVIIDNEFFSPFSLNFKYLIESIDTKKIHSAVFELYPRTEKIINNEYHTIVNQPSLECHTSILYLNSNNGYTELLKINKINCESNKLVTFKTMTPHRESTSTDKNKLLFKITYEL